MARGLNRRDLLGQAAGAALLTGLPSAGFGQTLPVLRRSEARTPEGKRMLQLYRLGVSRLMARPGWDPTSYIFQTNIHWVPDEEQTDAALERLFTPASAAERPRVQRAWDLAAGVDGDDNQPGIWISCPHSTDEPAMDFLPWHRLYLWSYERILEAAIGQPFRLPYWDYARDASLPIEFVEAVDGSQRKNPLFDADRKSWLNLLPRPQPMRGSTFSYTTAMAQTRLIYQSDNKPGFSLMLEESPHNDVHASIGIEDTDGNPIGMASPSTAARDPVFWLHHANIDRVWEGWRLADANGDSKRDGPADWRGQRHHFAAPDGRRLILPTDFGLRTRRNLGYEYDRLESSDIGPVALNTTRDFASGDIPPDNTPGGAIAATGGGFSVDGDGAAVDLDKMGLQRTRDFLTGPPKRFYLMLTGITATQSPATSFSVVVNQPRAGGPAVQTVLGTFSLFGAVSRPTLKKTGHQHPGGLKVDRIIDITDAVAANPDIAFGTGKVDLRIVPAEKGLKLGFQVESVSVFQE